LPGPECRMETMRLSRGQFEALFEGIQEYPCW
jgi:hypothetical protein